ncbi:DUF5590 domain-containing protein [Neobacillus sp. OS1-32]|uniref:DUF5590 domain-containing protein n=1 Tax=Neobacillus paridis TaxID=2803862 RepID=A0ABS1TS72_9BACI|nr:DUF5590 domain-containing protein [Neobacillus sp. OS1-32]MBL4954166.1 DUF5590 domain-containing protein [Neobacillus paridis]WML30894.1 DUF5590 domain-containing protein [Neobacillus sp. OS1-32]
MKKWIISIPIVLVLIFVAGFFKVYYSSMEPVKAAERKSLKLAGEEISKVDDFHIYNGQEQVNVLEGRNKQGKKIIVWIPEKSKQVIVKQAKDGISKEEAIQKLMQEKNPKKIISVRLGMEKNIPLWEIYYRSQNNLINYYYIDFETGKWLKKIENL